MENSDVNSVFEDLGKLDEETKGLQEEVKKCAEDEEAVVGFLAIVGKVLKQVFDL